MVREYHDTHCIIFSLASGCNKTRVTFSEPHPLTLMTTSDGLLEASFYLHTPPMNTSWALWLSLRTIEDNKTVASVVTSHTPGQINDDLLDIECYGNTSITPITDPWTISDSDMHGPRGIKLQVSCSILALSLSFVVNTSEL